ncbi:MAG: pyridoxamine kinase [Deltaproteobacteria bacterium]|jgi:pyridoxine kinase|nr:pyridoxamine kinase [Deltaproteobacteria bacterium]
MRIPVPQVAAIHDLSGFGRASLTVAIPVLSAMGVQVCPLPTAVLSTQTSGFDDFCFVDLSVPMRDFLAHWRRLGLLFDAVYSGFLGAPEQTATVGECIEHCLRDDGLAVVDPVLGDNGRLDPTMSMEMVEAMRLMIGRAHCITPNLTEAAMLLGETMPDAAVDQRKGVMDVTTAKDWLARLARMGPSMTVITSVPFTDREREGSSTIAYNGVEDRFWRVDCDYIPAFYPGTGDAFTSALTGGLLRGDSLPLAMDRAVQFVTLGLRATFGYSLPAREGIILEKALDFLRAPLVHSTYKIL